MNNDDIDNMIKKYIYESPDGGKTITKREFGSDKKEYVKSLADKKEIEKLSEEYKELVDDDFGLDMSRDWLDIGKTYTIDSVSPTTLTTSTLPDYTTGTIDLSSVYQDVDQDITLNVEGEERKVSELFKTVDVIKKRLSILEPKKEMLEKYKVLQDLYEQYKAAEALLDGPDAEGDNEIN